jgi:WD40 repeat protein
MISDEILALGQSKDVLLDVVTDFEWKDDQPNVSISIGDGDVWIGSIEDAIPLLTASPLAGTCKDIRLLKGHVGPVSCIFTSDDLLERSFILTGGKDCSSRIWNIE